MKRRLKLLVLFILCFAVIIKTGGLTVYADEPYKTFTVDGYGYVTETQAAYTPYDTITKIDDLSLSAPRDMAITKDGYIYIADTGNCRIIISTLEGSLVEIIEYEEFKYPCGIYVTEEKELYVADKEAKAVFVFNPNGEFVKKYEEPKHPLYGEAMDFKPIKLVVNHAGNLFIVCEANTNGIVQIAPTDGGTFLGYFGTNFASRSLQQIFLRMVLTDAQRSKMVSNIPSTPDNLAIDEKGLIYTVTRGEGYNTLKKLNIAGKNLIDAEAYDEIPAAVTTGNYENIYVASSLGYIYEFNGEGELLFLFGGSDDGKQRIGLCKKVEAIQVDAKDRLYVLDSDMSQIHIFAPTEFTNLLHNALFLYSKGRYTESKEPLTQVLKMNSLFDYANKAMGRAYLQEEDYKKALSYARLSKDWYTYSDALWETRNLWIRNNIVISVGIFILGVALIRILKQLQKKKGIFNGVKTWYHKIASKKLFMQLRYSLYYIKHPLDGCYGVKREGKASFLCANILLITFITESIIYKYFCGFLLKNVREGRYSIGSDVSSILLVFLLLTICNYLICAINDGEGSFKQIYCSFVYCLTPYLLIKPIIFVLSQVVTFNESFIIRFANLFMICWIIVLILATIKEINNYTVKETAKVIGLTFFAALIAVLVLFILYVLWTQVFDFIIAICGEVVYRFGF